MKAQNTLAPQAQKKVTFSAAITSDSMQNLITKSLGNSKAAARFTSSVLSIVTASEQLRACEPTTVINAALRGEGMGLIIGHGYYVVPYGSMATFSLSYKGYIQLAMSTGMYADIDCIEVREGECKGRNRRTGKPNIDLSVYETDEEREAKPVIGYYGYFELKDGTFRYEYWPIDKLLRHADRYSPAFSYEKYKKMMSGELEPNEIKKLLNGTPWYDVAGGQEKMCKKTVIRQLLNSGYAPLSNEVKNMFAEDAEDGVIPENPTGNVFTDKPIEPEIVATAVEVTEESIDKETGEVIEAKTEGAPKAKIEAPAQSLKARKAQPAEEMFDDDPVGSFFN